MTDWVSVLVAAGDLLLAPTLSLPRDVTLVIIAGLLTLTLLALQLLLGRHADVDQVAADERTIRRALKQSRRSRDLEAVRRHRSVRRRLAARRLRLEGHVVLVSLIPALLVFTWGTRRLDLRPIAVGQPLELVVTLPPQVPGRHVHLVPQQGLTVESGWIRTMQQSTIIDSAGRTAVWKLSLNRSGSFRLVLRYDSSSVEHPVLVGARTYLPPESRHADGSITRLSLEQYVPFGLCPAIPHLGLAPWMVGLLLLTTPTYLAGRRILRR